MMALPEDSENLKKLQEITPTLDKLVQDKGHEAPDITYETVGNGTFIGFILHNERAVAAQRVFMSKGTEIPPHHHEEKEFVIVYSGSFKLMSCPVCLSVIDGQPTPNNDIFKTGDAVYFPPNQPHGGLALEDTWIVSITVPSGGGYPNGGRK